MRIALRGVEVRRGEPAVLRDITLELGAGEALVVAGPSGAGKSTLIATLLGLVRCRRGSIELDGAPIDPTTRAGRRALWPRLGWVPQRAGAALPPRWSIVEAVADPLRLRGVSRDEAYVRARAALAQVGLDDSYAARLPHTLSGGQQQRAVIARALVVGAELLLLDEPSSALDGERTAELAALLRALQVEGARSLLIVSHDVALAHALGATVAHLQDGAIDHIGSAEAWSRRERDAWTTVAREALEPCP